MLVRYEESLRSILKGLAKNTSLKVEPLLYLAHSLIDQALGHMQVKSDEAEFFESGLVTGRRAALKRYNLKKTYELQECVHNNSSIIKKKKQ